MKNVLLFLLISSSLVLWIKFMVVLFSPKGVKKNDEPIEEDNIKNMGEVSDGYHTFNELYEIRKAYNVALFNTWAKHYPEYQVYKSWYHNDGEPCFGGGWFIVGATLPTGQISNHYKEEDWGLFNVPIHKKAPVPFDGHTTKDVIDRLINHKI